MTAGPGDGKAFWRHVRHELGTPLSAILGYTEMLLEDADDAAGAERLRAVHRAGSRLLEIVNEQMAAERIDGTVGTAALAADLLDELRGPIDDVIGHVELMLEEARAAAADPSFLGDLDRIREGAARFVELMDELFGAPELDELEQSAIPPSVEVTPMSLHPGPQPVPFEAGSLLVVDDNVVNRDVLRRRLERQGHQVTVASGGREALDLLRRGHFDLVLLDVIMPEMNGYRVLEKMKVDLGLRHIPVIMISALGDMDSVVRCIELGAEDYLPKPFNPVLLRARIGASLTKKRLRDREQTYLEQLRVAKEESEALLLNVLPQAIADRLKRGESAIADNFVEVTVLFADLVGFTDFAARVSPASVVDRLNDIFSAFDGLAERHGVEKIKTIGDAYLAVGGLPVARADHAEAVAELAIDMMGEMEAYNARTGEQIQIRIGLHSGPVVAGIIGTKKFSYDLWGDTVNTASRMESQGLPGTIQVSAATWRLLRERYDFEPRGTIDVKGKGTMATALLRGRSPFQGEETVS